MSRIEKHAVAALERRFGKSAVPYVFRSTVSGTTKCIDVVPVTNGMGNF
jgi:hypothetical protein